MHGLPRNFIVRAGLVTLRWCTGAIRMKNLEEVCEGTGAVTQQKRKGDQF